MRKLFVVLLGGVAFPFGHSFGIFVDGKQAFGLRTGPFFDPLTKVGFGLNYRW